MALLAWTGRTSGQVDADSPVDEPLISGMNDDLTHLRQTIYGDGAGGFLTPIDGHNHDGANSALFGAAAVNQTALKTSQGFVSTSAVFADLTLPGGEYGFYPQIKMDSTAVARWLANVMSAFDALGNARATSAGWTAYVTNITLGTSSAVRTIFAQQRYVTSSGEIFWIFLLRDKISGKVISSYASPDHPCFGNGSDPDAIAHPFLSHDPATQEIVVIQGPKDLRDNYPSWITDIKSEGQTSGKGMLQTILEDYEIDDSSSPVWDDREITVGLDHPEPRAGMIVNTIKKPVILAQGLSHRLLKRKA